MAGMGSKLGNNQSASRFNALVLVDEGVEQREEQFWGFFSFW